MKKPFILLLAVVFLFSCKKTVEKVKEEAAYNIMTTGQWRVSLYTSNTDTLTNQFSAYLFRFNDNRTVDALKSSVIEKSGTWSTDEASRTITSNFVAANTTLTRLNGTWTFIDAGTNYVIAVRVEGAKALKLRLDR